MTGLPEFDFPPLDPIIYDYAHAVFDAGAINVAINISNFICVGFAKTRFLNTRSHFADEVFHLEIDIEISKLTCAGKVDTAGTLGGFALTGKGKTVYSVISFIEKYYNIILTIIIYTIGHLNVTVEDLQESWIMKGHVTNDTWTVEDFYVAPSIRKMKVYFEDFFDGNKELSEYINSIYFTC